MLRVSKLTDYGVLLLNQLMDAGAVQLSAEDLAQRSGLNLPTVRKVLKTLVDSGLIKAQRGAGGGYRLARAATQIPVLDIVQAFEGPLTLASCGQDDSDCELAHSCTLPTQWGGLNQLLAHVLARISLLDLRKLPKQDELIRQAVEDAPFIKLVNI